MNFPQTKIAATLALALGLTAGASSVLATTPSANQIAKLGETLQALADQRFNTDILLLPAAARLNDCRNDLSTAEKASLVRATFDRLLDLGFFDTMDLAFMATESVCRSVHTQTMAATYVDLLAAGYLDIGSNVRVAAIIAGVTTVNRFNSLYKRMQSRGYFDRVQNNVAAAYLAAGFPDHTGSQDEILISVLDTTREIFVKIGVIDNVNTIPAAAVLATCFKLNPESTYDFINTLAALEAAGYTQNHYARVEAAAIITRSALAN